MTARLEWSDNDSAVGCEGQVYELHSEQVRYEPRYWWPMVREAGEPLGTRRNLPEERPGYSGRKDAARAWANRDNRWRAEVARS